MKRIFLLQVFIYCFFCASAQSVGVVLSGGGAKGLSHIGVIKVLEENNIPIDYICGTSMGAVIASMYAMGLSPDEMYDIVSSREFGQWSNGEQEDKYASSFYREEVSAGILRVALRSKKGKLALELPSSIVTPYPMDLAMLEVYASPSVAAGYNFENFMVPFFCVSSDVKNKRKVVHTKGDLGAAVRASMTYPFIFKPIMIDSTVLFDGGFYDNFPWKELKRLHSPDFIIGSKCVSGDAPLDDEDIIGHLTNMIVSPSDFSIPEDEGIVIGRSYPYGVMEFDKAAEIVAMGYEAAQEAIGTIKEKVSRRRSALETETMRYNFRQKCRRVMFAPQIEFEGNLNEPQKQFVEKAIAGDGASPFDFTTLKKGYYKVASAGLLNTFYPSYMARPDSLLTLRIRASAASPLEISLGGNISSAHLNQGYLGAKFTHFGKTVWTLQLDGNIGMFYNGGGVLWRYKNGTAPLLYFELEAGAHRFKYGVQSISEREYFLRGASALALDGEGKLRLKGDISWGRGRLTYLPDNVYRTTGWKDRSTSDIFSPSVSVEKNLLNYPIYPTEGYRFRIGTRWNYINESYVPGETSIGDYSRLPLRNAGHSVLRFGAMVEGYVKMGERFRLGYNAELALGSKCGLYGYIPELLQMPAFTPFLHSTTLLLKNYRADNYIGFGVSPVICLAKTLFLHSNISYFQPYRQIYEKQGGEYGYRDKFEGGSFLGNIAVVWQSPVGPVSFSASYYQRGEQHKWYPQLNVGFLLFKRKILQD